MYIAYKAHSPCSSITHSIITFLPHPYFPTFLYYLVLYSMHLFAFAVYVSVSNSLSTSSKTYCFPACCSLLFLCHLVLLSFLTTQSFPLSPCHYTFSIIPYGVYPFTSSFSLTSPLHSAVTFICSFIAFFALCLINSLSIAPFAGFLFF